MPEPFQKRCAGCIRDIARSQHLQLTPDDVRSAAARVAFHLAALRREDDESLEAVARHYLQDREQVERLMGRGSAADAEWECLRNAMVRQAWRYGMDSNRLDDVVQDASIRVYKGLRDFHFASSLVTWVSIVLKNSWLGTLRSEYAKLPPAVGGDRLSSSLPQDELSDGPHADVKPGNAVAGRVERNRLESLEEILEQSGADGMPSEAPLPEDVVLARERVALIMQRLQQVCSTRSFVVIRLKLLGWSDTEIADKLHMNYGTVGSHISRVRDRMKSDQLLEELTRDIK